MFVFFFATASSHLAHAADKSAAMVLDANTGKVLYARNSTASRYPASLTKMMTLYMVFDELEAGRMTFKTPIKMTANAAKRPPSKLGIKPGRTILLKHAIRALVTKSANDVAAAVAEHIAGSEAAFARRMTQRARAIGMQATTFKNASGLTHEGQRTTARDMITLALRLQDDHPEYFHLFSTRSFHYHGKTYRNHNTLLRSMRGVNGIKTGYTRASGFNLVTSMRHGRKHVVAAVFGGKTARARNARMRSLLYKALKKASTRKTRRPAPLLLAKPSPAKRSIRVAAKPRPAPRQQPSLKAVPAPHKRPIVAGPPPTPAPRPFRPVPSETQPIQPRVAMARVRPVSVLADQPAPRRSSRQTSLERSTLPELAAPPSQRRPQPRAMPQMQTARMTPGYPTQPQRVIQGRLPSTLNQQAAQLTGRRNYGAGLARMESRWGLNGPRPPRQATFEASNIAHARGVYQIQVGAFPSAQDASRVAEDIRNRMPQVLQGYHVVTMPVTVRGKQLWRARFAGFASSEATKTCNHMRRNNVDCFVARP